MEISPEVIEIRGIKDGELTVPELVRHMAFLAADTQLCILILIILCIILFRIPCNFSSLFSKSMHYSIIPKTIVKTVH